VTLQQLCSILISCSSCSSYLMFRLCVGNMFKQCCNCNHPLQLVRNSHCVALYGAIRPSSEIVCNHLMQQWCDPSLHLMGFLPMIHQPHVRVYRSCTSLDPHDMILRLSGVRCVKVAQQFHMCNGHVQRQINVSMSYLSTVVARMHTGTCLEVLKCSCASLQPRNIHPVCCTRPVHNEYKYAAYVQFSALRMSCNAVDTTPCITPGADDDHLQ
jgi:hypothetical protein